MPAKRKKSVSKSLANDAISRATLGKELQRQIDRLGLSRNDAARIVRDAASQMSRLMTGHFNEFSADRMVKMLTRLGTSVDITIKHGKRVGKKGRVTIRVTS